MDDADDVDDIFDDISDDADDILDDADDISDDVDDISNDISDDADDISDDADNISDDTDDISDDISDDSIIKVKIFLRLFIRRRVCDKSTCLIATNVIKCLHPVSHYGNTVNENTHLKKRIISFKKTSFLRILSGMKLLKEVKINLLLLLLPSYQ